MAVPADVLNKPGPLDPAEWQLMRTHPEAGVALLGTSTLGPLVTAVIRDHHERMDGSGYPRGAVGDDIHPFARIAAVADVYDAITSARPYKAAALARVGVQVDRRRRWRPRSTPRSSRPSAASCSRSRSAPRSSSPTAGSGSSRPWTRATRAAGRARPDGPARAEDVTVDTRTGLAS